MKTWKIWLRIGVWAFRRMGATITQDVEIGTGKGYVDLNVRIPIASELR